WLLNRGAVRLMLGAMKVCVSFEDLLQIHRPQIDEIQRFGELFPNATTAEASQTFANHVRLLDGTLRQTYREAAALAKRTEDLQEIAEIWSRMSSFCKRALEAVGSFKDRYPECGTPQVYDLALDYKLACDKRHRGVLEEIECQSTEFPK